MGTIRALRDLQLPLRGVTEARCFEIHHARRVPDHAVRDLAEQFRRRTPTGQAGLSRETRSRALGRTPAPLNASPTEASPLIWTAPPVPRGRYPRAPDRRRRHRAQHAFPGPAHSGACLARTGCRSAFWQGRVPSLMPLLQSHLPHGFDTASIRRPVSPPPPEPPELPPSWTSSSNSLIWLGSPATVTSIFVQPRPAADSSKETTRTSLTVAAAAIRILTSGTPAFFGVHLKVFTCSELPSGAVMTSALNRRITSRSRRRKPRSYRESSRS